MVPCSMLRIEVFQKCSCWKKSGLLMLKTFLPWTVITFKISIDLLIRVPEHKIGLVAASNFRRKLIEGKSKSRKWKPQLDLNLRTLGQRLPPELPSFKPSWRSIGLKTRRLKLKDLLSVSGEEGIFIPLSFQTTSFILIEAVVNTSLARLRLIFVADKRKIKWVQQEEEINGWLGII